jgi:Flp pilus assembly protein TadB
MVNAIEYVDKETFNKLREEFRSITKEIKTGRDWESNAVVKYEYNHEFPETESLIFLFVNRKFAVTIKHEIEGQ